MSKDYTTITANNNGLPFPDTQAIDASGPTATDGTELLKEVANDVWNGKQAELDFFNYPPNGQENLPGVSVLGLPLSQPLLAKYLNHGTPGEIISLAWNIAFDPVLLAAATGCDVRLLFLNGQGIDRTLSDYILLDSLCYVGDAANGTADSFYHADDASGAVRNTTGDYLILPDSRGYFLRGFDPSGVVDPDGTSRIVGNIQDDALHNIVGSFDISRFNNGAGFVGNFIGGFSSPGNIGGSFGAPNTSNNLNRTRVVFDASDSLPVGSTSTETRPSNIAIRHAIRY